MITITGSSGFVGKNLLEYLKINSNLKLTTINLRNKWVLDKKTTSIIHLAGIAHDLNNNYNSNSYLEVNYGLTKSLFDEFINSEAQKFIYISSIKAVTDAPNVIISEDIMPNPISDYGKSKLLAEKYLLSRINELNNKKVYIIRPTMIYGPGNKGNLNLLYNFVIKGIPWPLSSFENKRNLCYIGNFNYIIHKLLLTDIPTGIYNVCDDESISTNEIINLIGLSINKKPLLIPFPKWFIKLLCQFCGLLSLPFNTDKLNKLTQNLLVSNSKIKHFTGNKMPFSVKTELLNTFKSFSKLDKKNL